MKAVYLEVGKRLGRLTAHRAELLCQIVSTVLRNRLLVLGREAMGSVLGLMGFLILMGAGGAEEMPAILGLGAAGLGLMWLGTWMGHAFYGQEAKAEWLRRMRERDGNE